MAGPLGPILKAATKALSSEKKVVEKLKRGRKRQRGRIPKDVKALMEKEGISRTAAEKKIKDKKVKPKESKTGAAKKRATDMPKGKRGREIKRLQKQQEADNRETSGGPRRRSVEGVAEGPNRPALSKIKPDPKMSPAQRRRRVTQGLAGGPRPQRNPDSRTNVRDIGEFTDTTSMVAERMGLGGRGVIDEDEIIELGGFEIRKGGGQIQYKKKGGPIGVGAARTGYGKVRS